MWFQNDFLIKFDMGRKEEKNNQASKTEKRKF